MWIIPKTLESPDPSQPLSFVLDTRAYLLDLNELSQICESSLIARSKPSRVRTWLRRWKRDTWIQHLYGRILKPSLAQPFTAKWTYLLEDIPANHSAQRENDKRQTTPDIYGRTSETQLDLFSRDTAFLKTSKDIFRLDSPQSLVTWKKMVIRQRGGYSARKKLVLHTEERGCLSWRSPSHQEAGAHVETLYTKEGLPAQPGQRAYRKQPDGRMVLQTVTINQQVQMNWPTPAARDFKGCGNAVNRKDGRHRLDTLEAVAKFGRHAQENHSTNGSRQGWSTPDCSDRRSKGSKQQGLSNQVKESWATPNTMDMLPPKTGEALARNKKKGGCKNLREDVNKPPTTGKLNPRWVEVLMGVPIGWVTPSCANPVAIAPMNYDCSEMELSLQQPN